jgi:hypothetical protein
MNITHVEPGLDNGTCKVWTDYGTYERWPGREHNGLPYWSWTPCTSSGKATVVTNPETIRQLETARSPRCHVHRRRRPRSPRTPTSRRHRGRRMSDFRDLVEKPTWIAEANCRGMNPDAFFPSRGEATAPIKAICRACDVQVECLAYAMNTGEHHGIWGGLSERERRRLRRGVEARKVRLGPAGQALKDARSVS